MKNIAEEASPHWRRLSPGPLPALIMPGWGGALPERWPNRPGRGDSALPGSLRPRLAPAPGCAQRPQRAACACQPGAAAEVGDSRNPPALCPARPVLTLQAAGCGQAEDEESQRDTTVLPLPAQ